MIATLRIAARAAGASPLRTFLTALGIGIGVATVIAMLAIIQGLNGSFSSQISQLGANTLYVSRFPWVEDGDWWKYRNRPAITLADARAIVDRSRWARAVAPFGGLPADLTVDDVTDGGVDLDGATAAYAECADLTVARGRFLTDIDDELEQQVVVIGADVAARLFPGVDPLGRALHVGENRFEVVGVLEKKGAILGHSLDNMAVVPLSVFSRLYGTKRDLSIAVLADPAHLADATDEITGILRRARQLAPGKDDDFTINRQASLMRAYASMTGALYLAATAIGLITLLVGGIGIMNIMLVSVRERTREIGVRRALGARQRTILMQFLVEAMLVALLGGGGGTALGLGGARVVDLVSPLAAAVQVRSIVLGVVFSSLVGLAFGLWPAWRAAQLDPIEALRYE